MRVDRIPPYFVRAHVAPGPRLGSYVDGGFCIACGWDIAPLDGIQVSTRHIACSTGSCAWVATRHPEALARWETQDTHLFAPYTAWYPPTP